MYEYLNNFINNNNIDYEYEKYTEYELNIINEYIKTGEYNIAEEDNNNNKIFNVFGLYNHELGKYNLAKKYYSIAIRNSDSDACYNLGLLLEEEKCYEESKYYYLKAIGIDNHCKAYINYAEMLNNEKRSMEALYYYEKALELYLDNKYVLLSYGKYLIDNKNFSKSEEIFYKILNTNNYNSNNYKEILYYYAFSLKENNNIEKAKKYFLECIELNDSDSMIEYALLLYEEKNIIEAKKYLLKAIEYDNEEALNLYLELYKNNMENYIDLKNINLEKINSIEIQNNINQFISINSEKKDFIILENKLRFYSKTDNCQICMYENVINIPLNCMFHTVCINCYYNIYNKKCPFCRL